jgi:dTDP-4-dehydrorhamnose 3,5-epimerase
MTAPATVTFRPGRLQGVVVLERRTFPDDRGYFRESFRLSDLEAALGEAPTFLQGNHARSNKGVLRGLHAENWSKLVYAAHGEAFVALADLRPDSPTFGLSESYLLGESNALTLFVPRGVAHGYYVLSDSLDYTYLATSYYDGSDTRAVAWDDPDLAVAWPDRSPTLSERDKSNPTMRQLFPERYS